MNTETIGYREIHDFSGYRIGDDGSGWSCRLTGGIGGTSDRWKPLKAQWSPRGYLTYSLRKNGRNYTRTVHRLVLEAFVGPCPPGMEGCHRDGDRSNNRIENLRWDTRQANVDDRTRHGTCQHGEHHYRAKLTSESVQVIRQLHAEGWGYKRLAVRFGLNESTVRSAVIGETWKHV